MKTLTKTLIKQKTKCDSLFQVKNLNLWGSKIQDIEVVKEMRNLEVLSLSFNNISSLKSIKECHKLKELYVRKNNIKDLTEIKHLENCKNLLVLWLSENPCCENKDYRLYVIKHLPSL